MNRVVAMIASEPLPPMQRAASDAIRCVDNAFISSAIRNHRR